MTSVPGSRTLGIVADLRLEVGDRTATFTGADGRLVLRSETPQMFLESLPHTALPRSVGSVRSVGKVAETLRRHGLELHVEGPDGAIVQLGSGAHSWWGQVLTGSSAVQLGSIRSIAPLLPSLLPRPQVRRLVGSVSAALVIVVIAAAGRRRSRIG